jgi:hypothetical protein
MALIFSTKNTVGSEARRCLRNIRDAVPLARMRISPLIIAISVAMVAIAALLLIRQPLDQGEAAKEASKKVTTEEAAKAAGAKVLPTDPKLHNEPK